MREQPLWIVQCQTQTWAFENTCVNIYRAWVSHNEPNEFGIWQQDLRENEDEMALFEQRQECRWPRGIRTWADSQELKYQVPKMCEDYLGSNTLCLTITVQSQINRICNKELQYLCLNGLLSTMTNRRKVGNTCSSSQDIWQHSRAPHMTPSRRIFFAEILLGRGWNSFFRVSNHRIWGWRWIDFHCVYMLDLDWAGSGKEWLQ